MSHRQNIVYHDVSMDERADSLKKQPLYVAGLTDFSIEARRDMYDLFVNGKCVM